MKKRTKNKNCGRIEIAADPECVKSLNGVFGIYTKCITFSFDQTSKNAVISF